jgi:hypothetical protein
MNTYELDKVKNVIDIKSFSKLLFNQLNLRLSSLKIPILTISQDTNFNESLLANNFINSLYFVHKHDSITKTLEFCDSKCNLETEENKILNEKLYLFINSKDKAKNNEFVSDDTLGFFKNNFESNKTNQLPYTSETKLLCFKNCVFKSVQNELIVHKNFENKYYLNKK